MAKITGVVFYQGPSCIDGQPIVGIATFGTKNEKTGPIVQTWIIREDIHPINAINTGADSSVCGNCPLRGRIADASERTKKGKFEGVTSTVNKGRGCYVQVGQAPLAIWNAYKAGKYPILDSAVHRKNMMALGLRYGSYGDPVAIPLTAWDRLAVLCTGKAEPGYTHQWEDPRFESWSTRVMASTHSVRENEIAHSKGWRTFRTVMPGTAIESNEIHCPASTEGGFTANCATCGACNGRRDSSDMRKNVTIVAHGGDGKVSGCLSVIEKSFAV